MSLFNDDNFTKLRNQKTDYRLQWNKFNKAIEKKYNHEVQDNIHVFGALSKKSLNKPNFISVQWSFVITIIKYIFDSTQEIYVAPFELVSYHTYSCYSYIFSYILPAIDSHVNSMIKYRIHGVLPSPFYYICIMWNDLYWNIQFINSNMIDFESDLI